MKNIELRVTNKFGSTYREKFDGRRFSRLVAKEAAERNICEYQFLIEFVKSYLDRYYSNEGIVSWEFSWLYGYNDRQKISNQYLSL